MDRFLPFFDPAWSASWKNLTDQDVSVLRMIIPAVHTTNLDRDLHECATDRCEGSFLVCVQSLSADWEHARLPCFDVPGTFPFFRRFETDVRKLSHQVRLRRQRMAPPLTTICASVIVEFSMALTISSFDLGFFVSWTRGWVRFKKNGNIASGQVSKWTSIVQTNIL